MDIRNTKSVKVLGTGCSRCKKTLETVSKVVAKHQLPAQVEYITDMMEIMRYDIMATPAVVVDGKVKIKGTIPTEEDVEAALGL